MKDSVDFFAASLEARTKYGKGAKSGIKRKTDEQKEEETESELDRRDELGKLSLFEFIPRVSPQFFAPPHLQEFSDAITAYVDGTEKRGRYVVTVPVRHGKSETVAHAIAWLLCRNPKLDVMYCSHTATQAQRFSRKARDKYLIAGGQLKSDFNTIQEWSTTDGGITVFTGCPGQIHGKGAHIAFFDDPLSGRDAAMSPDERDRAVEYIKEIETRLHANGALFLISARWHVDDPTGQLLKTGEYKHIHRKAIEDEGLPTEHALWEEVRPLDDLKKLRKTQGEYNWYSLYQGEPRPPESGLFRKIPSTFFEKPAAMQIAIGIDLGFSEGGDASAAVVLGIHENQYYVLQVEKWNKNPPAVSRGINALLQSYPGSSLFTYTSGPEKGTIDLFREPPYSLDICPMPARYNKYVRALATSDAWNEGRIHIPQVAQWDIPGFVTECQNFNGAERGEHDDQVDALVSAFDALNGGAFSALVPGFYGNRAM